MEAHWQSTLMFNSVRVCIGTCLGISQVRFSSRCSSSLQRNGTCGLES